MENPTAYFVLDLIHDRFSIYALRAYERACRDEFPNLAKDILEKISRMPVFREHDESDKIYDGGPANVMSLRDIFAAQAMGSFVIVYGSSGYLKTGDWPDVAKGAYGLADAMLKARKQ